MNDLDRIVDYHLSMVGGNSAERITDQIPKTPEHPEQYSYPGSSHPAPVLASMEPRRIVSGEYVCVYKGIGQTAHVEKNAPGRYRNVIKLR